MWELIHWENCNIYNIYRHKVLYLNAYEVHGPRKGYISKEMDFSKYKEKLSL